MYLQSSLYQVPIIIPAGSGAAYDAYTKTMLHFNGSDASTTFTDEIGRTWTAYGDAQLDTAQYKFGTASGYFDGTGDYIDTPYSADFNVGNGDFTVDMWMRTATYPHYLCGQGDSAGSAASTSITIYENGETTLAARIYYGSSSLVLTSTGVTFTNSTWHHIAFVRNGNTLSLYVNGILKDSADCTGITVNSSTNNFAIGRRGEYTSGYWNGHIDEFRFSKGIARWTSDFTPPTSEYST